MAIATPTTIESTNSTPAIEAELLSDIVAELSTAAKRRILAKRQQRVDGMRSSETPGHAFWFPMHRADLARAREVLGL